MFSNVFIGEVVNCFPCVLVVLVVKGGKNELGPYVQWKTFVPKNWQTNDIWFIIEQS
jgi:hypothetical protein